ncbi:MAG: GNAT family N-acetyltransferase [Alicyclobacillus sp.]|nr:GNAT family N-acetyltransferase [Alicyclobacillus sp.]
MCVLHESIFTTQSSDVIEEELSSRPKFLILVAMDDDRVVGYKIGYHDRKNRFYSWLGGVYPEYRNRGIASELMKIQHEWCKLQGYSVIRTQTKNKWRSMLMLNLRHGFDVIGTYTDETGEPKIIMEKRLCRCDWL